MPSYHTSWTPVLQDNFEPGKGNALQAAVASLLGLPLHSVPNFIAAPSYEDALRDFLTPKGLRFEKIPLGPDLEASRHLPDGAAKPPGTTCVLRGTSPRGPHGHVVVAVVGSDARSLSIVHDPHPEASGLSAEHPWGWALFLAATEAPGPDEAAPAADGP